MISRRRFLRTMAAAGPGSLLVGKGEALESPHARDGAQAIFATSSPVSETARSAVRFQEGPYAVVLGIAQDGGMPQAGCYTERCERAREGDATFVTSLALVLPDPRRGDAKRVYLVDASPDLRQQFDLIPEPAFRRRAQARRPFDGIFLTHAHMGHYLGLALLGREGLGIAPTPVYCTEQMRRFLTENGPWSLMVDEGRLTFPPIRPGEWHPVERDLEVRMLPVPHRPEFSDTVAFQFRAIRRTLLYLPDIDAWNLWDHRIEDVVAECDVALLDGSFWSPDEVPGRRVEDIPHPMIPDTMARLESHVAQGKRVVFIHLNNTNPALDPGSPEARQVAERGFQVARQGMTFPL